ncbi:MAG TPA: LysR family transcriptional regulator [Planctomycetota bacterium]|nr:LysR family transcriptional regulator [Planctomycetota bacterium]
MMNLEHVRTFVAIVDAGGFQKAGAVLSLAQPTVSQQLRKLEEHLKARLLTRTSSQVVLTRHGERFLPLARSLLRSAGHAEDLLHSEVPTIGASSNVGIYMLQRYLRAYADRDGRPPAVPLRIAANPAVHEWVRAGEVDLGIVEWWPETPGFEARLWRRERLVAILPPGHRLSDLPRFPSPRCSRSPSWAARRAPGRAPC